MEGSWVDFRTIKQSVTMQMVLEHYGIKLRRSGKELRGKCPIHHGEGDDALRVNPEKNVFQCWSCHAKGNVLDFVVAMEHSTLREAGVKMSEWFSIPATPLLEAKPAQRAPEKDCALEPERTKRNKVMAFRLSGIDPAHPYLKERGIELETAQLFGAGYFAGKGSMHGRLVIPIENEVGELVAYVGRTIDASEPKYKFPPGFHKSQVVFNLNLVLGATWPEEFTGVVVLVEGFFDCMKLWQAGIPSVALMGCSLSDGQLELLVTNFDDVVLMLDGDEAGRAGTVEVGARLIYRSFVRAINLPDGKQPDQLSKEEIQDLLSNLL